MEHIDVSEFKMTCLETLERIRQTGEPLAILNNGQTLAVVYPPPMSTRKGAYGAMRGTLIEPPGDLMSPVWDENWKAAEE